MDEIKVAEAAHEVMARTIDIGTPEEKIVIFKSCSAILENMMMSESTRLMMRANLQNFQNMLNNR